MLHFGRRQQTEIDLISISVQIQRNGVGVGLGRNGSESLLFKTTPYDYWHVDEVIKTTDLLCTIPFFALLSLHLCPRTIHHYLLSSFCDDLAENVHIQAVRK